MKTHPKPLATAKSLKDRRGVALITVLTIISLCTILILTFFQLAQNEMVASDSYNNGLEASQVAEQAVNLVIRQIREATSGNGNKADLIAWASQPGAIRTWDKEGKFHKGYKLYSDDMMVVAGSEKDLVTADYSDLSKWDSKPWQFVDLNEPVIRGDKVYFPIVDSSARELPKWPTPLGKDNNGIEGFDYNLNNVAAGPMKAAVEAVRTTDNVKREPVPMPVMWIYQLKDGSLGHMDDSRNFRPATGGASPSEENPIVARFAFWADDETCKLNPNIHAGGATWTTPMASGMIDRNLGRFQPAQHEWQRYPGHPASTHLAPVLAPGIADITFNRDNMESIFSLVPRVVGGGSMSGTRKINTADPAENNGLRADKDRLYASLDEFFLEPGVLLNPPTNSPSTREPNKFPDPNERRGGTLDWKVMRDQMERMKFFLSVVSRAPETTIFNTPRVSIWPTRFDGDAAFVEKLHHTPFDKLIRFCAEIGGTRDTKGKGGYRYHFERLNADSMTFDADKNGIPRNRELLDYLDKLTSTEIPGVGKDFGAKYSEKERRQIITMIFDYIRSTNLHDDSLFGEDWNAAFTANNTDKHRTYTNGRRTDAEKRGLHKGYGQVTPIKVDDWGTKGMGRFYTLSDVSVVVIACADGGSGGGGGSQIYDPGRTRYVNSTVRGPSGIQYSNFPPLAAGVTQANEGTWPNWLQQLKMTNPELIPLAFDEKNWNWQLAWLDPSYGPTTKFNRGVIPNNDSLRLQPRERMVQAMLVWNLFTPSLGWAPINPDMLVDVEITGMTFEAEDHESSVSFGYKTPIQFGGSGPGGTAWSTNRGQTAHHDRHYGGTKSMDYMLHGEGLAGSQTGKFRSAFFGGAIPGVSNSGRVTPVDGGFSDVPRWHQYNYVTRPFKLPSGIADPTVTMNAGKVGFRIYSAGTDSANSLTEQTAAQAPVQLVQDIEVEFPEFTVAAPYLSTGVAGYLNEDNALVPGESSPMEWWSLTWDGANPQASAGRIAKASGHGGGLIRTNDVVQSVGVRHGDIRMVAARSVIKDTDAIFMPHPKYGKEQMAHDIAYSTGGRYGGADGFARRNDWLAEFPGTANANRYQSNNLPVTAFDGPMKKHQLYGDFDNGMGNTVDGPYINKADEGNLHSLYKKTDPNGNFEMQRDYGDFPYFVRDWIHESISPSYFTPNRLLSSPVQFGSLPVGTTTGDPWRTLLFRPEVVGNGYSKHPGAVSPADHYLLDLFWMPVVEPYAISEPLSTGGKVNLNYQILPFRHINRSSAIRGVLKSEYMLCVPNAMVLDYKTGVGRGRGYHWRDAPYNGTLESKSLRAIILEDETLAQFEEKFNNSTTPTIFRTASEICEIHLVPEEQSKRMRQGGASASIGTYTPTVAQMANGKYWRDHAAVGDNAKERPYSNIYARVTTKSNTYKVHYRAQVLSKAKGTPPGQWDPLVDQVDAEYRGSSIVERYVEPSDPAIPDYAKLFGSKDDLSAIDEFYKFRVVHPTRFAP